MANGMSWQKKNDENATSDMSHGWRVAIIEHPSHHNVEPRVGASSYLLSAVAEGTQDEWPAHSLKNIVTA